MTKSLMTKASTIVAATPKANSQRPIATCVDGPRAARIAPATTPVAPMLDSKQKQCASRRSSAEAARRPRRRMAMSRTKLCASNSAERLRASCQTGMAGEKYGRISQLVGAMIPIANTSFHSARVIVWFIRNSATPGCRIFDAILSNKCRGILKFEGGCRARCGQSKNSARRCGRSAAQMRRFMSRAWFSSSISQI